MLPNILQHKVIKSYWAIILMLSFFGLWPSSNAQADPATGPGTILNDGFCSLNINGTLNCDVGSGKTDDLIGAFVGGQFCTLNAEAARYSCYSDFQDERWLSIGNCLNSNDPACIAAVEAEVTEAKQLCGEQFDARIEVCAALGEAIYDPVPDPANFVDPEQIGASVAENPYFPLVPGRVLTYQAGDETVTVTVTGETKEILGVKCAVLQDVVEENGEMVEDTFDWYAQDNEGNVWYFGEIARNFEDGEFVNIDGSWKAGVDGAKIGIIMPNQPAVGTVFRQEFALGEAEDMGEILSITGNESAPGGSCSGDCVVTKDYTPLEPTVEENKYYAAGIGAILVINLETGEREELISVGDTSN